MIPMEKLEKSIEREIEFVEEHVISIVKDQKRRCNFFLFKLNTKQLTHTKIFQINKLESRTQKN